MNRRQFIRDGAASIVSTGACLLTATSQAFNADLSATDPWVTCQWQSGTPWTVRWLKIWSYHPALSDLSDSEIAALCANQEKQGQVYVVKAKARESAMKNRFGPDREHWQDGFT